MLLLSTTNKHNFSFLKERQRETRERERGSERKTCVKYIYGEREERVCVERVCARERDWHSEGERARESVCERQTFRETGIRKEGKCDYVMERQKHGEREGDSV